MADKTETLHTAMAAAFGAIEGATKSVTGQVGQQKYMYADIGSVIAAIKPALIANGLFFTQHPQPSECGVTVETMLHHTSGASMSLGALFVPAKNKDAQAFGSALTYARRYALVTAFGVPVEDDDGHAAVKPPPPPELIGPDDVTKIEILLEGNGIPIAELLRVGKLNKLTALPAEKVPGVMAWIEKQIAAKVDEAGKVE